MILDIENAGTDSYNPENPLEAGHEKKDLTAPRAEFKHAWNP